MSNFKDYTSYYLVRGRQKIKIGMSLGKHAGFTFNSDQPRPSNFGAYIRMIKHKVKKEGFKIVSEDQYGANLMEVRWIKDFAWYSKNRLCLGDMFAEGTRDNDNFSFLPMDEIENLTVA